MKITDRWQAVAGFLVVSACVAQALAAGDVPASKSLTVQAAGPRGGGGQQRDSNVEGKNKEQYASFGVLVFASPKGDIGPQVSELTLTLVQSIPAFASDGKIKFYLGQPAKTEDDALESSSSMRIQRTEWPAMRSSRSRRSGSGTFKKVETGRVDTFKLTLDEPARGYLRDVSRGRPDSHCRGSR